MRARNRLEGSRLGAEAIAPHHRSGGQQQVAPHLSSPLTDIIAREFRPRQSAILYFGQIPDDVAVVL